MVRKLEQRLNKKSSSHSALEKKNESLKKAYEDLKKKSSVGEKLKTHKMFHMEKKMHSAISDSRHIEKELEHQLQRNVEIEKENETIDQLKNKLLMKDQEINQILIENTKIRHKFNDLQNTYFELRFLLYLFFVFICFYLF